MVNVSVSSSILDTEFTMGSFGRRDSDGHESYLIDQQIALPMTYGHVDANQFGSAGPYGLPQHALSSYAPQFTLPYTQQSMSPGLQPLAPHYSPGPSMSTASDSARLQHQSSNHSQTHLSSRDALDETEIESQESPNESTMLSEPIVPPLDGFPDAREFDRLIRRYIEDLSVKKRDKALIPARRARNIRKALFEPKNTSNETAQFRFWVKKMFSLRTIGTGSSSRTMIVCHTKKPVAIREKLFKILTTAHQQCQHGGRDKTSAQVRRIYSWVPKELIARFVKLCPTCRIRRGGLRATPPNSRKASPRQGRRSRSPKTASPSRTRRESEFNGSMSPQAEYLDQLGDDHPWVDSEQEVHGRHGMNPEPVRAFDGGALGTLSNSVSATLDPFTADVAIPPSQIDYSSGYVSAHGVFRP